MFFCKSFSGSSFKRSSLAFSIAMVSPAVSAGQSATAEYSFLDAWQAYMSDGGGLRLLSDWVDLNGTSLVVDGATAPASYRVVNGGSLKATDHAVVNSLWLRNSTASVSASVVKNGVLVSSGNIDIDNSRIENPDEAGLVLSADTNNLLVPSTAKIINSDISGLSFGAVVGMTGEMWIENSTVTGSGQLPPGNASRTGNGGVRLIGGVLHVSAGSHIQGEESGLSLLSPPTSFEQYGVDVNNVVEIDGSSITAKVGPAILVDRLMTVFDGPTTADIKISNGSALNAGNGRLIDVLLDGTANIEIDDSRLHGDLVGAEAATLNVTLRNNARLDGNIINGNSLVIDSSGYWQLAADNSIKSLAMDGGSVGFSEDAFHTLTVGGLSGRGVFDMRIDLDNGVGDLLNVAGEATGKHWLKIRNTGLEAVPAEFDALRVVHTDSGDAAFGLVGGRADLGVYSYALEQQGNDWFIVGSGKIVSPSTQSALALFSAGPTIWNSELTTLRSRMGEVRGQEQGGGWIRSYGNRFNASLDAGVDYQQKQQGLSFGADAPIPVNDGHLLVGLMGGYSKSDLDMSRGTSGEVDSYYVGAYGTWLSDEGYYVDGVLKLNQFHNASKVAMSDSSKAKGDYSNKAVGGSVEFGKHIKLPDDYFVAPYAQLSSVWIEGDSYTLDNGLQARTSQTQSVLGKVGSTVGRQFALKDGGVVQPYVRVALAHEFSRSNDVSVNDQRFDNDLFGSRAELGAGVSVALSERLQVHADFDYMKGEHVEQPWGANVGLRLAF